MGPSYNDEATNERYCTIRYALLVVGLVALALSISLPICSYFTQKMKTVTEHGYVQKFEPITRTLYWTKE